MALTAPWLSELYVCLKELPERQQVNGTQKLIFVLLNVGEGRQSDESLMSQAFRRITHCLSLLQSTFMSNKEIWMIVITMMKTHFKGTTFYLNSAVCGLAKFLFQFMNIYFLLYLLGTVI